MITLFVSCSKEPGHGLNEGDVIRFTVQSADMETRTMYGERTSTKQPILWVTGDEIHIVMYNPDNYAGDHQYAKYKVKAGGSSSAEIELCDGYEALTYKSSQTKVVAYYLPGPVVGFDHASPSSWGGSKGFLFYRFYPDQSGTVEEWPEDYDQHSSPVQNMDYAPLVVTPTNVTSAVVTLSFEPLFTAFEITVKNTYWYARYVYGLRIWSNDYDGIVGDYVVRDITDPFSGSLATYFSAFPPTYYAGMDYSFDGEYNNAWLARVNGQYEYNEGWQYVDDCGTFTFTIFCPPLTYSNMSIQICGGELGNNEGNNEFITTYPLTMGSQPIQFAAKKKHVIEIELPT